MAKSFRELADIAGQSRRHYQNIIDMVDSMADLAALEQHVSELQSAEARSDTEHQEKLSARQKELDAINAAIDAAKANAEAAAQKATDTASAIIGDAKNQAHAIITSAQDDSQTILKPVQDKMDELNASIAQLTETNAALTDEFNTKTANLAAINDNIATAKQRMAGILASLKE